jgi:hypothetical protein
MESQLSLERPQAAHAKSELVEIAYQASASKNTKAGSFDHSFQTGAQDLVVGEEPILVTKVHIGINAKRPLTINFCPSKGYGFEIASHHRCCMDFARSCNKRSKPPNGSWN